MSVLPPAACEAAGSARLADREPSSTSSLNQLAEAWQVANALTPLSGPPAVETSIAVEDAVENRGLYRVSVSRLF